MYLVQPQRLGGQALTQTGPVGGYPPGIVTDMIPEIEAVPWRRAATAGAQGL